MIRKTLIVLVWGMLAACSSDVVTYPFYTYTEEEESVSPFTDFSFPLAEFQKATTVLVHTPGEELSSQQGHTKVFDVPAMREEHLQYMDVLRQQGIRVFELTDVLINGSFLVNDKQIFSLQYLLDRYVVLNPDGH